MKHYFTNILISVALLPLALGNFSEKPPDLSSQQVSVSHSTSTNPTVEIKREPKREALRVLEGRVITAYTPSKDETDNTPCITATGLNICQDLDFNVVATNELPFNSIIRIDGKKYIVFDRMNNRYSHRYDILMITKKEAHKWGKKILDVEILE